MGAMGNIANILPYLGASASGLTQGYLQKQDLQNQDEENKLRRVQQELANRQMGRQFGETPMPFFEGLTKINPGFSQIGNQQLPMSENLQLFQAQAGMQSSQAELENARRIAELRGQRSRPGWDDPMVQTRMLGVLQKYEDTLRQVAQARSLLGPQGSSPAAMQYITQSPFLKSLYDQHQGNLDEVQRSLERIVQYIYSKMNMTGFVNSPRGTPPPGGNTSVPSPGGVDPDEAYLFNE